MIGMQIAAQDCLRIISQEAEDHSTYWHNRALHEHKDKDAKAYCRTMASRWQRLQSQLLLVAQSLDTGELVEPCAMITYPVPPSIFSPETEAPTSPTEHGPAADNAHGLTLEPSKNRITVNFVDGVPVSIQSSPETPSVDSSTPSEPSATMHIVEDGTR